MTQTRAINAAAGVIRAAWAAGRQTPAGVAMALESACLLQSPESAAELARLRAERHATNDALAQLTIALRSAEAERDAWRAQRNDVFATNTRLLARIEESGDARLRAENEARTATRELDQLRARLVEPEAAPVAVPFPPRGARCACGHSGADHHHPGAACWGSLSRLRAADGTVGPVRVCDCTAFESVGVEPTAESVKPSVEKLRGLLSRQPADVEDPCRPCGCPKRFDRHAWGCPTLPVEDPHDSPLHHQYAVPRDLPEVSS